MKAILFPKSELTVNICSHRYGADMTYTEQTDSIFNSSRYAVEYYAHKYGAKVGSFINGITSSDRTDLKESEQYGACKFGIYFPTDYWYNPSTKAIEVIPDYYATQWTQIGIDTFSYIDDGVQKIDGEPVSVGSAKLVRAPNMGKEMYAYSDGKYGWNDSGHFGLSSAIEIVELQKSVLEWYKEVFGYLPSTMSYRNGRSNANKMDVAFFLQCRNSNYGNYASPETCETWYGKSIDGTHLGYPAQDITRDLLASRASTSRWWDWVNNIYHITKQQSLDAVGQIVALTLANNGWYNNFTHWHSVNGEEDPNMRLDSYDDYFSTILSNAGENKIHFCSYSEATEYMIYRSCIDNVAAFVDGNRVRVAVSINDIFAAQELSETGLDGKLPIGRIHTPISIEIDLTGTPLQDKNIMSSVGKCIDVGDNKIIVEVPFPQNVNDAIVEVELFDNIYPDWLSVNKPQISNVSFSNGRLTFNTDIPCYSSLFLKNGANDFSLISRQIDEYTTEHSIKIEDVEGVSIGVISEAGITSLIDLN